MSKQTSSKYSFTTILAHWDNLLAGAEPKAAQGCMVKGCPLEATATGK